MTTKKKVSPIAKKKITKTANKKVTNSSKTKTDKNVEASQKINLDHNFSFNLLTEKWIPVVSIKGERKLLSLNEFLKQAHEMERFDFPLPGLETAVIRFLVAIVYIVGAPKDKNEWENWYKKGKFDEEFTNELQKYSDKLDLFSKEEPFLQEVELKNSGEKDVKSINRLIHFFPYDTNPSHWMHKFDEIEGYENGISPQGAAWMLFLYNCSAYSGGSGYKPGINGKPPNYVILIGENLFETIVYNTLSLDFITNSLVSVKRMAVVQTGFPTKEKGELMPNNITMQAGLIWQSRQILFIPQNNLKNKICEVGNVSSDIIIKKFILKPQFSFLKKGLYWSDPNVIRIDFGSQGQKNLNESGMLPTWRDYPALLFTSGLEYKKGKAFAPLVIQQLNYMNVNKRSIMVQMFSFSTINNAKLNQMTEQKFFFSKNFIDNEELIFVLNNILELIKKFKNYLNDNLKRAYNIKKNSNKKVPEFESAYWHELGRYFEESLVKLVESYQYADEVYADWKKVLASHVRKTFERHTEKLIHNPKNLKAYENGRRYLEINIHKELL